MATRARLVAVLAGLWMLPAPACAHEITTGDLVILHPYTTEPADDTVREAAVYMTIRNRAGAPADRLIGVASPLAGQAVLQRRAGAQPGDLAEPLAQIAIPPGADTTLGPAGGYVQLSQLKVPLYGYASFALTLTFEKAGLVEVDVQVEER